MNDIVIKLPDAKLDEEQLALYERVALDTCITDQHTAQAAANRRNIINSAIKDFEEKFEKAKKAAHQAHKEVLATISALTERPRKVVSVYDAKLREWQRAEQARCEEEYTRARAKAEEEAAQAALRNAALLESTGDLCGAELALAEPTAAVAPPLPQVEKIDGVSFVARWDCKVTDPKKVPRQYLLVDMAALRKIATALKDKAEVPGVHFFPIQSVRSR